MVSHKPSDFGKEIGLLYGEFQLQLDAIDDLVNNSIRSKRISELDANVVQCENLINKTFQDIISRLNSRKSVLVSELKKVQKTKKVELQQQKDRDLKIQTQMHGIKTKLRGVINTRNAKNNNNKYDINWKKEELKKILVKYTSRKDLRPSIDDITLTLMSFRSNDNNIIISNIPQYGIIDNEDEKVIDNLKDYYKCKDGILDITVVCAQSLMAADANGKSDPFTEVMINNDSKRKKKTKVVKANLNPTWDEKFTFNIKDSIHDMINIKVYDYDRLSKNDQIGQLTVPVINILKNSGFIERNYTFTDNKYPGKIQLMLEYSEK